MTKTCLRSFCLTLLLGLFFLGRGANSHCYGETVSQAFSPVERLDQSWRVSSFLEEGDLSNKYVTYMDFEEDGTAWFSTSDGLYRYDGYSWDRFSTVQGLPSNFVRCVLVSRDGRVWVGTDRGTGFIQDKRFTYFDTNECLAGPSVRRICEDAAGDIWFCCDRWPDAAIEGGLSVYSEGEWTVHRKNDGFPSSHVLSLFADSNGRIFVSTIDGLFERRSEGWVDVLKQAGFNNHDIILMLAESEDHEIFASSDNDIFILKENRWSRLSFDCPHQFSYICSTKKGRIVACGSIADNRQAFFLWDGRRFNQVSHSFEQPTQLISTIGEAPDGSIWCCGFDYLFRWQKNGGEWREYDRLPSPRFVDNRDRLWFVDGKNAVRLENNRWYRTIDFPSTSALDSRGDVWAWEGNILKRWSGEEIVDFDSEDVGISSIQGFVSDSRGFPWIYGTNASQENTLAYYDKSQWIHFSFPEIQSGAIRECRPDPQSGIWVMVCDVNNQSLRLIKIDNDRFVESIPFSPGVRAFDNPLFRIDRNGGLWLYARLGLHFMSPLNPLQWRRIEPLPGKNLFAGVEADSGMWFGCDGIIGGKGGLLNVCDEIVKTYDSDVRAFGTRSPNGVVFFGGDEKFYCIPSGEESKPAPVSIPHAGVVRCVVKDSGGRLWLGVGGSVLCFQPDGVPPETTIDEAETELLQSQSLRVRFSAVEWRQPKNNRKNYRYSWRIDSDAWSDFNPSSSAIVPMRGLLPGAHLLQARARDESGDIDKTPAEIVFFVHALPFQKRTWFGPVVLSSFVLIVLLVVVAFAARRKLAINIQNLETIVDERTAALRENETRLRNLIETSIDWIWEINLDFQYTDVSPKVRDILGYAPQDMIGKTIFTWMTPDEATRFYPILKTYMDSSKPFQCLEYSTLHKEGRNIVLESSGVPIVDGDGKLQGFRGIDRDVTDRKQAEIEKKELEDQLYQSQKMEAIGQLAGGMAHDFNNLLTVIVGNLELAGIRASDDLRVFLNNCQSATSRASALVKQLLAFSRKSQVELKSINVNDLVRDLFHLVRETIDRRIDIYVESEKNLPLVDADPSQLNSVLMNLCLNARDAIVSVMQLDNAPLYLSRKFTIGITTRSILIDREFCRKHTYAREGRYAAIRVSDNGIGMDSDTLRRVFEPFFTTKQKGKGTGLGLANAYAIVKQHNGWIAVESEPGEGSVFSVYLPVCDGSMDVDSEDIFEEIQGGDETILFIDDEELIRNLNKNVLEENGYTVLLASDGEEGLNRYYNERENIDLIIIDYSMPRLSGAEVLRRIFAVDPHVKAIVSSGFVDEWKAASLAKLGVAAFLDKPFRSEQLLQVVRNTLDA